MIVPRRPVFGSQDWMLAQQVRAEMEADAWRRLRELSAAAESPYDVTVDTVTAHAEPDYHNTGSTIFKALVRIALGAFGAYLAWLAAVDAHLGEFEIWLAVCATYVATLALSLFGPVRGFVHLMAETMRWIFFAGAALGALWLLVQGPA